MPKAGSRTSSPGTLGRLPSPTMTRHFVHPQFLRRRRRAVNLDLIGLGRRLDVVGELDLRHDEAVLARELAPHLGDARGDLVVRGEQRRRQLLAEAQLDLDRLQLLLDRGARLGLAPSPRSPSSRPRPRAASLASAAGDRDADEGHQARRAARTAGTAGPARRRASNISSAAMNSAIGIVAELAEHRLVGRAARAALGDQQAGGERDDQRRDLRDEAVADRELGEDVGGGGERQAVPRDADDDAAEDVDRRG